MTFIFVSQGGELTSITFNEDGHLVATRGMDDTVKLWDIRKLGDVPVKTFTDVSTHMVSMFHAKGGSEHIRERCYVCFAFPPPLFSRFFCTISGCCSGKNV